MREVRRVAFQTKLVMLKRSTMIIRCKKPVNADKQFTIQEAPSVLTVHLKRFSPMGRKIGHPIRYDERLSLEPFMSEGSYGPTYTLYGVICHAGGGPNSGHYYAYVKGANGVWHEMNDESVMRQSGPPTGLKNAYILFYILEKGQTLEAALTAPSTTPIRPPAATSSKVAQMKKRKAPDSEPEGERPPPAKAPKPFIGPLLPSQTASQQTPTKATSTPDPQAEALKKKIAAVKPRDGSSALKSLAAYGDEDDDDEDVGEKVSDKEKENKEKERETTDSSTVKSSSAPSRATTPPSTNPTAGSSTTLAAAAEIHPSSFYGGSSTSALKTNDKKRKSPDEDDDASYKQWAKTPIQPPSIKRRHSSAPRITSASPFDKVKGSNNLHSHRDPVGSSPNLGSRFKNGPRKRLLF